MTKDQWKILYSFARESGCSENLDYLRKDPLGFAQLNRCSQFRSQKRIHAVYLEHSIGVRKQAKIEALRSYFSGNTVYLGVVPS